MSYNSRVLNVNISPKMVIKYISMMISIQNIIIDSKDKRNQFFWVQFLFKCLCVCICPRNSRSYFKIQIDTTDFLEVHKF